MGVDMQIPLTRVCTRCNVEKPLVEEFYPSPLSRGGRHTQCKKCQSQRGRAKNFPISVTEKKCSVCKLTKTADQFNRHKISKTGLSSSCKSCISYAWFKTTYGLEKDRYLELVSGRFCKTCERSDVDLVIDHCHTTGRVRGAICSSCNCALGNARDDPRVLINCANYLTECRKVV